MLLDSWTANSGQVKKKSTHLAQWSFRVRYRNKNQVLCIGNFTPRIWWNANLNHPSERINNVILDFYAAVYFFHQYRATVMRNVFSECATNFNSSDQSCGSAHSWNKFAPWKKKSQLKRCFGIFIFKYTSVMIWE